jgi:hypothetical protein
MPVCGWRLIACREESAAATNLPLSVLHRIGSVSLGSAGVVFMDVRGEDPV